MLDLLILRNNVINFNYSKILTNTVIIISYIIKNDICTSKQ